MSFRPKGEIYLRSLTFVRDDRPWPVTWRLCTFAGDISDSELFDRIAAHALALQFGDDVAHFLGAIEIAN